MNYRNEEALTLKGLKLKTLQNIVFLYQSEEICSNDFIRKYQCITWSLYKLLQLLHLSDIHFCEPDCLNERRSREHTVREHLIRDIKEQVETASLKIDAILVTGDIAFKAHPDEFDAAAKWLDRLACILGITSKRIYTVPGNHDVNRDAAEEDVVEFVREKVTSIVNAERKNTTFQKMLSNRYKAELLLHPMDAYNTFAAPYECNITDEKPYWTHEIPITSDYELHINGLTSTFFSGKDDSEGSLYLGPFQANLMRREGVVNLAMLHHPQSWLEDGDISFNQCLKYGAELRLMGHEHVHRVIPDDHGVSVIAGSTNPDRYPEGSWEPAYGLISLSIDKQTDGNDFLDIGILQRIFTPNPASFVSSDTSVDHRIQLINKNHRQLKRSNIEASKPHIQNGVSISEYSEEQSCEVNVKDLVYDFWGLSAKQKRDVVSDLDLLEEESWALSDAHRYTKAMSAAKERNLLEKLFNKIQELKVNP